jgi:hypothetical protein
MKAKKENKMPIVNTRDQFLSLSQRMQLVTAKAKCNKLRKKYRKNPPSQNTILFVKIKDVIIHRDVTISQS